MEFIFHKINMNNNLPEKSELSKKKKINFSQKKENTIKSLNDVEYFLNNFKKLSKVIKLYKIIK